MDKQKLASELVEIAKQLTAAPIKPTKALADAKKYKTKVTDATFYLKNNIDTASRGLAEKSSEVADLNKKAFAACANIASEVKKVEEILKKLEDYSKKK